MIWGILVDRAPLIHQRIDGEPSTIEYGGFSHDVTAAILVSAV